MANPRTRAPISFPGRCSHEMVTGKRPFDADSLQGICGRVLSRRRCRPLTRILRCLRASMESLPAAWQKNVARYATAKLSRKISIRWARHRIIPQAPPQSNGMVCATRGGLFRSA